MSLLNELSNSVTNLKQVYNEPDMDNIIDRYCNYIISHYKDTEIAEKYVSKVVKERFESGQETDLNEGHIFSGILYNEDLHDKFINWYKANYLTYEDINSKYKSIDECIIKNADIRVASFVISTIIENGSKYLKDPSAIKESLHQIDLRHDEYEKNNQNYIMSRTFEKAVIKTAYMIVRDFSIMQILEYVSSKLDFQYEKPVVAEFGLYSDETINISAANNIDMVEGLKEILQRLIFENEYTESDYFDDRFDSSYFQDVTIYNDQYDEMIDEEDENFIKDNDKANNMLS